MLRALPFAENSVNEPQGAKALIDEKRVFRSAKSAAPPKGEVFSKVFSR